MNHPTKDISSESYGTKTQLDGFVRNIAFTNTATDTTMRSPCTQIETTPVTTPVTTPATTTVEPEPECGCYAKNEEIEIENDKCIMNLGSFLNTTEVWYFEFDFKINSLPAEQTDPRWFFYILSGIVSLLVEQGKPSEFLTFFW